MMKTTDEFRRFLNLQLFAEGDDDGTGGDDSNGGGTGGDNDNGTGDDGGNNGQDDKPISFDDFLKEEGNQAEFDRRVQKAISTAIANEKQKWQAIADDQLSEAEKLARMTKEQKAEYKAKKLEEELNKMKRKEALAEMSKTARKMLVEEKINIPDDLLERLVSEDADKTKQSVEAFAKLFNDAVREELKKTARQDPPMEGGQSSSGSDKVKLSEMAAKARIIKEN